MANHPSALKRARQNKSRRLRNMFYKTQVKKSLKEVRAFLEDKSLEKAQESLRNTVSILQKASSRGVIHKRNASRKISRLSRHVHRLASSATLMTTDGHD